jgi:A/G-specific adenine glycosylase
VIWKGDRVLISQRPPEALLGGLWEYPGGKNEPGESPAEAVAREAGEELNIRVGDIQPFTVVEHAYTHFRVTLHVLQCCYQSGEPQCRACTDWRWESVANLSRYAFPTANRKIIAALLRGTTPDR